MRSVFEATGQQAYSSPEVDNVKTCHLILEKRVFRNFKTLSLELLLQRYLINYFYNNLAWFMIRSLSWLERINYLFTNIVESKNIHRTIYEAHTILKYYTYIIHTLYYTSVAVGSISLKTAKICSTMVQDHPICW